MVSHVPEQTKWSMGSSCQEDTDIRRSLRFDIFFCAESLVKRDIQSKKGKQTIHFQSTTQTRQTSLALIWYAISDAVTPQHVVALMGAFEIKKLVVVKDWNFPETTSRT